METSGVSFGTSGARGLVADMCDQVCYIYTLAFLQYLFEKGECPLGTRVGIAGDLRKSTGRIMGAVASAVQAAGCQPVNCGRIPSPAIACYGLQQKIPTIMVTGSHIPDDRNGIKFNLPGGEILKVDEQGISSQNVTIDAGLFTADGMFKKPKDCLGAVLPDAESIYIQRYLDFFPEDSLAGMKVGLYEHSGVGRDILFTVLSSLGADVVRLGRSDAFVPVDTEAIRQQDIEQATTWVGQYGLDAIVSTDGDADRPLVGDEKGEWLRGDVAGVLCAEYLGVAHLVTPVSSNSVVEKCRLFQSVTRTQIGSPYVIAGMQQAASSESGIVAGYEANGGFLLQTRVVASGGQLDALPTRDAVIVIVSLLVSAWGRSRKVSELAAALPSRYTASDRVKQFATDKSRQCINRLFSEDKGYDEIEAEFGSLCGNVKSVDLTDGLRITFSNNEIVHLRPSGNAPEFRCYNEADSPSRVTELNSACMQIIQGWR